MSMEIKYLLKFTSKHEHAKDLIDGRLFMNQAAFIMTEEKDRAISEKVLSPTHPWHIGGLQPNLLHVCYI